MPSVLFVCTANQTRSPIAAALFTAQLKQVGKVTDWRVESAGTWAVEKLLASHTAQRVMQSMGHDLSKHRTRCVTGEMLASFDLILVMEAGHKEALQAEFPAIAKRVFLLAEMAGATWDVADPSAGTDDDVRETARVIAKLLEKGKGRIRELTAPPLTIVPL